MIVVDTKDVALAMLFWGFIVFSLIRIGTALADDESSTAVVWFVVLVAQAAMAYLALVIL